MKEAKEDRFEKIEKKYEVLVEEIKEARVLKELPPGKRVGQFFLTTKRYS